MTEDIRRQMIELTDIHRGLINHVERNSEIVLSGMLSFEASADGLETITESFEIELVIPHDFPNTFPKVREIGGKIGGDYTHINLNGTLCLAVPIEQRRVFFEQPTLLGFVNRLVIPYLYGYCFWRKYGQHPFDEAAHGNEGILRHYTDVLELTDESSVLAVISSLFEYGYRRQHDCPCGSGIKTRKCHGPVLRVILQQHTSKTLQDDFIAIFEVCFSKFKDGKLSLPIHLKKQVVRIFDKLDR